MKTVLALLCLYCMPVVLLVIFLSTIVSKFS